MSVGDPTEYERTYFAAQAKTAWRKAHSRRRFALLGLGVYLTILAGLALELIMWAPAEFVPLFGLMLLVHIITRGR